MYFWNRKYQPKFIELINCYLCGIDVKNTEGRFLCVLLCTNEPPPRGPRQAIPMTQTDQIVLLSRYITYNEEKQD